MMTMKVEEFISKLGSTESVPSGGSTVGVISAFAGSLALMASNVSVVSKKSMINDSNKPYVDGLISKLEGCVERFKFFATQDAVVFEAYMKASKDDKKDKMMDCLSVPLSCARECLKCMDIMVELSPFIVSSIVSDMMIGFIMLRACFESSIINITINEKWINDEEISDSIQMFINNNIKRVYSVVDEQLKELGGRM